MKMKRSNILKASIVLVISLTLIGSGATVYSLNDSPPLLLQPGKIIMVENTTADRGDINHLIRCNGTWDSVINGWHIYLHYDPSVIEAFDSNFEGCFGEGDVNWFVFYSNPEQQLLTVEVTYFNIYYSGEGTLINLLVNITDDAPVGQSLLDLDDIDTHYTIGANPVYCDALYDGYIEILQPPNQPPYEPSDPDPADGATDVAIDAELSWTGGDPDSGDTVTYDVYFDDESPPQQVEWNQTETTYDPGTLEYETTYYWKIVARDDNGASNSSDIWSFTTVPESSAPVLKIESITGGLGFNVVVKNDGDANATDVYVNGTIEGGLIINQSEFSVFLGVLDTGKFAKFTVPIFGIGLGILTDIPTITVTGTCAEGSTTNETADARIILIFVII